MGDFLVITALISGAIGLMLLIVGSVFTGLVAIGNNQKIYGWLIFLCFPLSIVYCAFNWDKAAYSGKMVFSSTVLLSITAIILKIGGVFDL